MSIYLADEVWAPFPIKGYPNHSISNYGRVLSKARGSGKDGKILKWREHYKGYFKAKPHKQDSIKQPQYFIHRLVALAFLPNPNKHPQVNHKNCNKSDNHVSNLEWCSDQWNRDHAKNNGLTKGAVGEKNHFAILNESQVLEIRDKFKNGYTAKMLSKKYGVSLASIYDIAQKRSWKHI